MKVSHVLVIGYAGDTTVAHVLRCLSTSGTPDFLELHHFFKDGEVDFDANCGRATIKCGKDKFQLHDYTSIYQRLMISNEDNSFGVWNKSRLALFRFLDLALRSLSCRIVNPPYAGWENGSKPLQTYLLSQAGFLTPRSLSTSCVVDYERFTAKDSRIFKSNSGERSIVELTSNVSSTRAQRLSECPVWFQEYIEGPDARIHTVANSAFGVEIVSDVVDYRYANSKGGHAYMQPITNIPEEISAKCIKYAASRGIVLAGFDFKIDHLGNWFCLEMNPSPGFEGYDKVLGGSIGKALVELLISI